MTTAARLALGAIIVALLALIGAYVLGAPAPAAPAPRWWGPYPGWPQDARPLASVQRSAENRTPELAKGWALAHAPPGGGVTLLYAVNPDSQGNFYWSPTKPSGAAPNADWNFWYYGLAGL